MILYIELWQGVEREQDFSLLFCHFNGEPSIYISRSNGHFNTIVIVGECCDFLSEFAKEELKEYVLPGSEKMKTI